jgi:hypothetical protein
MITDTPVRSYVGAPLNHSGKKSATRVQFRASDELIQELELCAQFHRVALSDVLRAALLEFLPTHTDKHIRKHR